MDETTSSTNEAEVVEKGKRGRQPTEYITHAKFIKALREGVVLPGMTRVPEVIDGARIVTHAGYTAKVIEPTSTGLNLLVLATEGRSMRPVVRETLSFTFEEVLAKLSPKVKAVKPAAPVTE